MGHPHPTMKHPSSAPASTHHQAEKSPFQQRDLSILMVGPSQLRYGLSRTRKPKSRYKTNTFCPSFKLAPTNFNTDFSALESRKVAIPATRFVCPSGWADAAKVLTSTHHQAEKSPLRQRAPSHNPGVLWPLSSVCHPGNKKELRDPPNG